MHNETDTPSQLLGDKGELMAFVRFFFHQRNYNISKNEKKNQS